MKKILIIAIGIILTSCHTIYTDEIESCNDICENNEGMKSINKDLGDVVCRCNNGVSKRFR